MSEKKQQLQSAVIDAFTAFNKTHSQVRIEGSARPAIFEDGAEGMNIDCPDTNQRVAIVLHPSRPNEFSIGIADKSAPNQIQSKVLPLSDLKASTILNFLEEHFPS